ncbi:MAG: hypothetical protein VKK04_04900 [Synechococcales bacterium]|nr:hypothetical protein [Synechococcales bacterium]
MNTSGHLLNRGLIVAIAVLTGEALLPPAAAQTSPLSTPVSIFEDVILTPTYVADSTTVRGISGGELPASQVSGRGDTVTGACVGFVDTEPDHKMVLTEYFEYLSLAIESPEDTTLVVRGPGGSWCNDDLNGKNPGISGQWFSGTYEIWVGSYSENTYHPYVIRISEMP